MEDSWKIKQLLSCDIQKIETQSKGYLTMKFNDVLWLEVWSIHGDLVL